MVDEVALPEEQSINIYLWETKESIFEVYKIARYYMVSETYSLDSARHYVVNETYSLDSAVIIELAKAMGLPVVDVLHDIPFIHSGYVSILLSRNSDVK